MILRVIAEDRSDQNIQLLSNSGSAMSGPAIEINGAPAQIEPGILIVRVIEARNLRLDDGNMNRPYMVIEFDKNEFISESEGTIYVIFSIIWSF